MKKRIFRKFNVLAAVPLVFALAALLTAMIAPINAFAVDIGGPTAEAWVTSGVVEGIGVTLEAIPANEASHTYSGSGPDLVFDAVERDDYFCTWSNFCPETYGLGVGNTLIANGSPGVGSPPAEIGYYGNTGICGISPLYDNCGDTLIVKLDKAVKDGNFSASFFYGAEGVGEKVSVEFFSSGVSLGLPQLVTADAANAPTTSNEGRSTHDLIPPTGACWNEIRFSASPGGNADENSDLLVEGIADLTVCEEPPPEISFTQGFFGSSPMGEALVAGLINENNCGEINTILTSIGASTKTLSCEVIGDESPLSHFLTGKVGPGKEKGADNIGFLPSGFEPHDNLAAQKITVLLNMELDGGINSGNFLNIDPVDGLDPILTTGGQLGTCTDSEPDGICDVGTVVLNALGEVVALLDAEGTTVGDVLLEADVYIGTAGEDVDPTDTVFINGVDLTVGQLTKILGMINESYDAGTPTGFVTVDVD